MADVDRHGIFRAQGGVVPHLLIDLTGGKDPPLMPDEQKENVILDGGEGHRFPVHRHRLGAVVHRNAAVGEQIGPVLGAGAAAQGGIPAELAFHPGDDLDGVKGLCDIVVGADVEPQNLVRVLAFGGEEDNGDVGGLPQTGRGPDAVQIGHHHIHENEVDVVGAHHFQRLEPVIGVESTIPFAGEVDVQRRNNVFIVITDQNVVHNALFHSRPY